MVLGRFSLTAERRAESSDETRRGRRDPRGWHLALILAVSSAYELLFLRHGLNRIDEGVVHYAAMQLRAGGALYRDIFFGFPPGHALPAWLGQLAAPPGILVTRGIYAALTVALCAALYALGRRLMPPVFALLGALLLAVAAPESHLWHFLFGYRYLLFSALALLCFAKHLDTKHLDTKKLDTKKLDAKHPAGWDSRWLLASGAWVAVSLCFRLTPALAVGAGIALAVVAADPRPRHWLREGGWLALGFAVTAGPLLAWIALGPGVGSFWQEVVVRPLAMAELQGLGIPALELPERFGRAALTRAFLAVQFRLYPLLYAAYAIGLAVLWLRARRRGEPFGAPLLLAVVIWGAVYFTRALGRSDQGHLDSTLPPACLLLAHALWQFARLGARVVSAGPRTASRISLAVGAAALAAWIGLQGSDRYLGRTLRGSAPFQTLGATIYNRSPDWAATLDDRVRKIRSWTEPDARILDLGHSPLFYVLAERMGPGHFDVVMPGTFLDAAEEEGFLARLQAAPPELVIWPTQDFDGMSSRALAAVAPRLTAWVLENYWETPESGERFVLLVREDVARRLAN